MRIRTFLAAAAVLCGASRAQAQTPVAAEPPRPGMYRVIGLSALAGLGLGIAYMQPDGEGWLLDDEAALAGSTFMGVSLGLATVLRSMQVDPAEGRRPRLHAAFGRSNQTKTEYVLGYRTPATKRFDVQGAVLVASDDWERTEFETRCSMFGCISSDFIVDSRSEQSVALVISGAYALFPQAYSTPLISFGAGPVITHVATFPDKTVRHTGVFAEAMAGFQVGGVSRFVVEGGARVITGAPRPVSVQVRIGPAIGY